MKKNKNENCGIILPLPLIKNDTLSSLDCRSLRRAIACATGRLNPPPPPHQPDRPHVPIHLNYRKAPEALIT